MKKKAEAEDMKEFLRSEILVRIEAGLAEPTTTSLEDTSDISIVSKVNILDLADRMAEGREMFSGKVAARGMVMGWRLELDMLTTQEWEDRRKLPALEIVDTLLVRAMDMADNESQRMAHEISVEIMDNILENTTASLDLEAQLANLKLATTDETDALSCPPATATVDNIVYGPENTASRKRRKHLRKSPLLRRIINMPDLSRIYDERGVYKPSFWNNPAVGCTDNTDYRDKHTKHVTGSEEAISTPGLFPVIVPGCEGAKETQNNNFSFQTFRAGGEDRNAQTMLNLSMTATLAPEYPILSE